MSENLNDVLFVGLGAVGSVYSFIIKRSGLARVTAVARGNYDIVNDRGIQIYSRKYGVASDWKPDRLCRSVAEAADRQYSYVVVTTKAIPELLKTPQLLLPFLSKGYTERFKQPTYVLMQNGLNVEVDLFNTLDKLQHQGEIEEVPTIISTALWIATNSREPNVIDHGDLDRVVLGAYRHQNYMATTNTREEEAILQDFMSLVETGGGTISVVPEVQRIKFAKNFWNVVFASTAALTRYTLPALFRPPSEETSISYKPFVTPITAELIPRYTIPAIRKALEEVLAVGRALGFPDSSDGLPSSTVDDTLAMTRALHEKAESIHIPSMLLDIQKGRPFEVEVILGEVVRMAKDRNVAIPRVELLYSLLLVVQNQMLGNLSM